MKECVFQNIKGNMEGKPRLKRITSDLNGSNMYPARLKGHPCVTGQYSNVNKCQWKSSKWWVKSSKWNRKNSKIFLCPPERRKWNCLVNFSNTIPVLVWYIKCLHTALLTILQISIVLWSSINWTLKYCVLRGMAFIKTSWNFRFVVLCIIKWYICVQLDVTLFYFI
jgi:hypothetical protein